ncbi:nitric oxide synthase oxygenase domain/subunit [Mucilaginibacter sp. UYNi724]
MKKLNANCLLLSGIKEAREGFSNESYKVPVLYWENCWPKDARDINRKQNTSKKFFIHIRDAGVVFALFYSLIDPSANNRVFNVNMAFLVVF